MPLLEDLGLRVVEEVPTRLQGGNGETFVQSFGVMGPEGRPLPLGACGDRVAECLAAMWRGEGESDSLNRLVVLSPLDWRRWGSSAPTASTASGGLALHQSYQNDAFAAHPDIAARLCATSS